MWLFRKTPDASRITTRTVSSNDLPAISRLLRDGWRRYYGLAGNELAELLSAGQGIALVAGDELLAVVLVSWPTSQTCWLRGLALAERLDMRASLETLIPALHNELRARGVREIYYAGDEAADSWLVPVLTAQGYDRATEVVVYEKRDLGIPNYGNRTVAVRPATNVDLAEILRLDRACFEPQWTKDDTLLAPAIAQGPLFLLAELAGVPVGYIYASSHFAGRLVHLVRIAVAPPQQSEQIGIRLMAEVVLFARAQGATAITLNTQAYNSQAQRVYSWFGFTPTGERQTVLRCSLLKAASTS